MRHALRCTVPLAFGLFVLATSASAECAWVLWGLECPVVSRARRRGRSTRKPQAPKPLSQWSVWCQPAG